MANHLPVRKAAAVGYTPMDARAAPGVNKGAYNFRPAKSGDATPGLVGNQSAGVTPQNMPITQKSDGQPDAGSGSRPSLSEGVD